MTFLKNHPFAVEAFFESSVVLTFAVPREQIIALIPDGLEPDTFDDKWAFVAAAMVQTRSLRPKGWPAFMGNDFFLVGFRVFVRHTNQAGKRLRGLYILKSETDKKKMELMGNLFTHYNYTTTDISITTDRDLRTIRSEKSGFEVVIEQTKDEIEIPEGSPFSNWKEARRYAGPLPYTFTSIGQKKGMLIIEGVRLNWDPQPLKVKSCYFQFLNTLNLQNAVLANAFEIKNVPYYWKRGRIE